MSYGLNAVFHSFASTTAVEYLWKAEHRRAAIRDYARPSSVMGLLRPGSTQAVEQIMVL
jgi:hypothetical protein